jgi:hypothetical protein
MTEELRQCREAATDMLRAQVLAAPASLKEMLMEELATAPPSQMLEVPPDGIARGR